MLTKTSCFRLSRCPVHLCIRSFVLSSGQILLPRCLTNGLYSFDKIDREYSVASTYNLTKFWRSKVKGQGHILVHVCAQCWAGVPSFLLFSLPCPFTFSSFAVFTFSLFLFLICFTCFLLLSIPNFCTRIVPLCLHARGHRRRLNLNLVCSSHFVLPALLT